MSAIILNFNSFFRGAIVAHLVERVRQPDVVLADGHAEPVDARHLAGDDRADCGVAHLVPASQGPV